MPSTVLSACYIFLQLLQNIGCTPCVVQYILVAHLIPESLYLPPPAPILPIPAIGKVPSVMSDSFVIPWTVAHQAPLSMGFPRQEYWRRLPFPSPGDLLDAGIKPTSPALAGRFLLSNQEAPFRIS